MNILFYTFQRHPHSLRMDEQADYQSDLLFHGLRRKFGVSVIDYPKKSYLYTDYPEDHAKRLWGRGFSYSRTLSPVDIDRTDLQNKIANGTFDLIVISLHHSLTCNFDICYEEISRIANLNRTNKPIAIVDGHDWSNYNQRYFDFTNNFFKREIADDADQRLKPIWFAIPAEKIVSEVPTKKKDFSFITPGSCESHWPPNSRKTHVYTEEADYYNDYKESLFALTCKKGGWDCMRHVEILANGCVPIFTDIEWCPKHTMEGLPKAEFAVAKMTAGLNLATRSENKRTYSGHDIIQGESWIDWTIFNIYHYNDIVQHLLEYTKEKLTTDYLADYFIRNIQND